MASKAYRLKPLEWEQWDGSKWVYEAPTVFGPLYVWKDVSDIVWRWRIVVDEYYDENEGEGATLEDAQAGAEEWYRGRVLPALTLVEEAPNGE